MHNGRLARIVCIADFKTSDNGIATARRRTQAVQSTTFRLLCRKRTQAEACTLNYLRAADEEFPVPIGINDQSCS